MHRLFSPSPGKWAAVRDLIFTDGGRMLASVSFRGDLPIEQAKGQAERDAICMANAKEMAENVAIFAQSWNDLYREIGGDKELILRVDALVCTLSALAMRSLGKDHIQDLIHGEVADAS